MPVLFIVVLLVGFFVWKRKTESDETEDDDSGVGFGRTLLFDSGLDIMGGETKIVVGYVNRRQVNIEVKSIGRGLFLEKDAATAFLTMQQAAADEGIALNPSGARSAYRTSADQLSLQPSGLAAPVNHSKHQAGLCIDLDTAKGTNEAFDWLVHNAHDFLFANTVPSEPWHWEFIG